MAQTVLEARHLVKRYGRTTALDDFSAGFEAGRIYGLLGRNGAGKTTLLNIMTARAHASGGTVTAFGEPVWENARVLPRICYMAEKNLFSRHMKVKHLLAAGAGFFENFDRPFAQELCRRFELDTGKSYQALSRGYESILRIVIGLASRAPITIFDEPVLGLDAAVREEFYRVMVDDFARHPRTYILSTHMVEESADLFDEAVIIRDGRLIEQTPTETMRENSHYVTGRPEDVESDVSGLHVVHRDTVAGVRIAAIYGALDEGQTQAIAAAGLQLSPVPIQKMFIYLTEHAVPGGEPAR